MLKLTQSQNSDLNYCAAVVQVEDIRVHCNADRLSVATFYGNPVIVSRETQVGQVGIFVPIESVLCHKFLSANNFYREANFNTDQTKRGYIELNRRIKCVKLRKEQSQGLFLTKEEFESFAGGSIDGLVGTFFDTVNDEEFVAKYEVKRTPQSRVNQQVKKAARNNIVELQFHPHKSTPNLGLVINNLNPEDEITISNKLHGCVDSNTVLEVRGRGKLTIGEIVKNKLKVEVKAWDFEKSKECWAEVSEFYFKENDGKWLEIELEDGTKLLITTNNPVWLPQYNCYREAGNLTENDYLLVK